MNLKKSTLCIALTTVLSSNTAHAYIVDMSFEGLFTMLDPTGKALQNTSYPYYGDTTWGYGFRTQITGTMSLDSVTGAGTGTITPFDFFSGGPAVPSGITYQVIGGGLMLGNMNFAWGGNIITTNIVLNASGLFAELSQGYSTGPFNSTTCASSGACALPASNDIKKGRYPIGPVPVATSSFNVAGDIGVGTTLDMLSLGTDDGIGGSPMTNGPFSGFNANFDMTTVRIAPVFIGPIPVPAAVWLFGSGLLGLISIAKRRSLTKV